MRVDGGILRRIIPAPRGLAALEGTWTGGNWVQGESLSIGIFRNGRSFHRLDIRGVDQPLHQSAALLLVARANAEGLQPGDAIGFGSALVSEFETQELPRVEGLPIVAAFGPEQLPCVIDHPGTTFRIVVFHDEDARLPNPKMHPQALELMGRKLSVLVRARNSQEPIATELVLTGNTVTLTRLVNTLAPLRNFTLGAGQEMLLGSRTYGRGGRFRNETLRTFETNVAAAPGSVRIQLAEPQPESIPLLVRPAEPYQLLAAIAVAVAHEDSETLFAQLAWHRIRSVDRLLGYVRTLAANRATVRTSTGDSFELNERGALWLSQVLQTRARILVRAGELFGADFRRSWCRVMTVNDKKVQEQWTLYFESDKSDVVRRLLTRNVDVRFETRSPPSALGGSGSLLDITAAKKTHES